MHGQHQVETDMGDRGKVCQKRRSSTPFGDEPSVF
jgi:hypothetical protein